MSEDKFTKTCDAIAKLLSCLTILLFDVNVTVLVVTRIARAIIRELKNHDDGFVDDDRK